MIMVVGQPAFDIVKEFQKDAVEKFPDPIVRLKAILQILFDLDPAKEKLGQFMLTEGILQGDMSIPLYLVSILKEIFAGKKDELEMRIIAIQILEPLYSATCIPVPFRLYSGVDIYDRSARENFIDILVDNAIKVNG